MENENQKIPAKVPNTDESTKVSKIEKVEPINFDPSSFITEMSKSIISNESISKLINSIPEVNFALCYWQIKGKEEEYNTVIELQEILDNSEDIRKKTDARKVLKKLEPKIHDKITLIINNLLMTAQNIGTEIGTRNYCYYNYNPDKGYWVLLIGEEIECLLSNAAQKSGFDSLEASYTSTIKKLLDQFIQSSVIPFPSRNGSEKSEEIKINLRNGTFVIGENSQELLDFDSKDFFTYVLPFDHNPEATCPIFDLFLDEVMPDKKAQMVMAEYIGYIFTKNLKLEKCLVLVGGGANGKSVFFNIINALLGPENVSSYSLSNLSGDKEYYRAELGNVLLNYSSELGGKNCDLDMVKQLISNEPVGARSPFGKPFTISNYCRFLFNTNILPRNVEQSYAYFRRFMFLEFDITIAKDKRDPDLANKIIGSELSGVFNWVLEGLRRLNLQRDFTFSEKIESALNKTWKESDNTALFMENKGYKPSIKKYETLKNLYSEYKQFCIENGYHSVSNIEFKRRLLLQKFTVESNKTNNATWVYCDNSIPEQPNHRTLSPSPPPSNCDNTIPEQSNHQETMDIVSKFTLGSIKTPININ